MNNSLAFVFDLDSPMLGRDRGRELASNTIPSSAIEDNVRCSATTTHILLISDLPPKAIGMEPLLQSERFRVTRASSSNTPTADETDRNYHAVLIELPPVELKSGLELCRNILARCNVPVIVAKNEKNDLEAASYLDAGAADFVQKGCSSIELGARLRSIIRSNTTTLPVKQAPLGESARQIGDLWLNPMLRIIRNEGESTNLSAAESSMLELLTNHYPRPVTRAQATRSIFARDWNNGDRAVDVAVGRLRTKLSRLSRMVKVITIRGYGYALVIEYR